MKKSILLIIISTTFVFGQFEGIGSSEYNFSYKNGKKIGSIIKSLKYQEELSSYKNSSIYERRRERNYKNHSFNENAPVYQFENGLRQGKVLRRKDYAVKKDNFDNIDSSLWYDYHFNVYSKYPNGQIKEEGSFEKRYGGERKLRLDEPLLSTAVVGLNVLILPLDLLVPEDGKDLEQKDYLFKDGLWTGYYEDGSLKYRLIYKSGIPDGQLDVYYKNGQKKYSGVFKGDVKKGKHAEWYASGWIKEYSVDGVVKRRHKESEKAFFWNSKNDKNYQAAYGSALTLYSEINNDSKKPLELESNSDPVPSEGIYETFVFTGKYSVFTEEERYYVDRAEVAYKEYLLLQTLGEYPTAETSANFRRDSTYCCKTVRIENKYEIKYTFNCEDGICDSFEELKNIK